jgi:hypothetical protein
MTATDEDGTTSLGVIVGTYLPNRYRYDEAELDVECGNASIEEADPKMQLNGYQITLDRNRLSGTEFIDIVQLPPSDYCSVSQAYV